MSKKTRILLRLVNSDNEYLDCNGSNRVYPRVYEIFRKPTPVIEGQIGFRYNGKLHISTPNGPVDVTKLPMGAKHIGDKKSSECRQRE